MTLELPAGSDMETAQKLSKLVLCEHCNPEPAHRHRIQPKAQAAPQVTRSPMADP